MLHVVALAATLMAPLASTSFRDLPNLRTSSPLLASLIAEGREHSPTFRRLADALEATNVIVYLEPTPYLERRFRGRIHFMGTAASYRYLRIQIRTTMNRYDIVSSIAHEMQHANEIAAHPEVVCEEQLAELYRRIGSEHDWCMFETDQAQRAGQVVRAEVFGM